MRYRNPCCRLNLEASVVGHDASMAGLVGSCCSEFWRSVELLAVKYAQRRAPRTGLNTGALQRRTRGVADVMFLSR